MTTAFARALDPRRFRAAVAFVVAAAATVGTAGCMCGAAAVPGEGRGAKVDENGVVIYKPTPVGDTRFFNIPIQDTADVDETLMSARIAGVDADAFEIDEAVIFPISMPAGQTVQIGVVFRPSHAGASKAQLLIETEDMGVSPPIELEGTGE